MAIENKTAPNARELPDPLRTNWEGSFPASATVTTTGATKGSIVAVLNPNAPKTASARDAITVALMVTDGGAVKPTLVKLLPETPREEAIICVRGVTPIALLLALILGVTATSDWSTPKGANWPVRSSM